MSVPTRKPSGKPPWPMLLIAGAEKSGKSYASAAASSSEHIGRTFWFTIGEDDPDEYGALPGARFEIAEHDGSYRGLLNALTAASAEGFKDGKPNLLILDSATRLWSLLSDMAQAEASARAKRKNRSNPDEARIDMDLWNAAKQRWQHVIKVLKDHPGPVVITARLESTTLMENDQPTKEKVWKVQSEKSLTYDVGAVVQLRSFGDSYLTGVRSLHYKPTPASVTPYPDFTVEKLWTDLGVIGKNATAPRQHQATTGDESSQVEVDRQALLDQLLELTDNPGEVGMKWQKDHGHPIGQTSDIAGLRGLVESIRNPPQAQAEAA